MGVVYWLKIKGGDRGEGGERDLYEVCKASRQVDEWCGMLGVRTFSSFVDEAGARDTLRDLLGDEGEDDEEPVESSAHDWHPAAEGLETIGALLAALLSNVEALPPAAPVTVDGLMPDLPTLERETMRQMMGRSQSVPLEVIIDELQFIVERLSGSRKARFHLALVS